MKRILINKDTLTLPHSLDHLKGYDIYDSSCSPEARVYFIDTGEGLFLKTAATGTLLREAQMTEYFNKKGLGAKVVSYISDKNDWLLTKKVKGEDCTFDTYLADPVRLADIMGKRLRMLHETSAEDCPVKDRVGEYIALAEKNYKTDNYDKSAFPDNFGFKSGEEAYYVLQKGKHLLKNEVLIHGDYCLPNIMLDNWDFSGFIDVGNGGIGDRHIDLFWGVWTLWFNLKTNEYTDRFLDAYGRDKIDMDKLKIVAAAEVFG
jgi:kanamycin kinase